MTALFALNPNMISHTLIDGHNDIVMVFWMLSAFYFIQSKEFLWAASAATFATLTKFTSVVLLPVLSAAIFLDAQMTTGKKIKLVTAAAGIFIALTVLFYKPFWVGMQTVGYFATFSTWFASNSVPYAVSALLARAGLVLPNASVKNFFNLFFAVNSALALLWLARRKERSLRDVARVIAWMFVAMYLSYTIPFYGHHLLWAFPFLILADLPKPLVWTTLYTAAGLFFYFKRLSVLFMAALALYGCFLIYERTRRRGHA